MGYIVMALTIPLGWPLLATCDLQNISPFSLEPGLLNSAVWKVRKEGASTVAIHS